MNPLAKRAIKVHERLLEFYGDPVWRNPLPAIDELVSTILSQNTNDVNRDRGFDALRAKFPTWEEVRDANADDVIAAIRVAGLANQKGPRIQQVLKAITEERGNLDLVFSQENVCGRRTQLVDKVQWCGTQDCRNCFMLFIGYARLPRGYTRLPRDGTHRTPP